MATYTKETALFDTGKIGDDIEEAGQIADRYISTVGSDGISVHAENNTSDYTKINGEGMEVYKDDVSIAKFGESVRIGRLNQGSISISDDKIIGTGENGQEFFSFGNSSSSAATGKSFLVIPTRDRLPSTSATGLTGTPLPESPDSGTTVTLRLHVDIEGGASGEASIVFNRGTSSTKSVTYSLAAGSYTLYATYDGNKAFTKIYSTPAFPSVQVAFYCQVWAIYTVTTEAPSYVIGSGSSATGANAVAIGYNSTASASNSVAMGYGLSATTGGQIVVGYFNKTNNGDVFQVGAGNSSTPWNAFSVSLLTGASAVNIHQVMTACVSAVVKNLTSSGKKMTLESAANCSDYLSLSNGGIKCARGGYVLVSAEVQFYGVNDNNVCNLAIYKGSSTVALSASRSANDRTEVVVASKLISVSADDTFYLYVSNTSTDVGQAGATSSSVTSTDKVKNYLTVQYV